MPDHFDLLVIGAGPAGEKGAAQAAYFGKTVCLVERAPKPGGNSVNTGGLPSKTLRETVLRFEVKAGPNGALFGSVTPTNIADEIWRTRKVRIDRRKIDLENIKRIGRYDVPIDVFQDVRVEVKTLVVPEGGELPSDEELEAMAAAELAEQQAAAPPESGPAEEFELLTEEIDAGPEDIAAESASDDFDETVEAAAEENEL